MTTIEDSKIAAASGLGIVPVLTIGLGIAVLTAVLTALSFGPGEAKAVQPNLPLPLIIHLATFLPALPLGAYLLLRRKGDRLHKRLGRIWAMLMVVTAIASFGVGDGLSFIHIFSVTTLISIPLAIWRIRVGDVRGHRRAMEAVYIGLVVAGAFTFVPGRLLGVLLFG
ncbi:DUF2306 domain-containing protein [Parasphingopyxis marina]|uniref:DUF2306 domain-containing protein n=1 Tax=Parasphingopyxis marina TaxID=2761622 RepID=A0A842HT25_9SPHN|nr:DUF2306 domain-containing protein [Parasphingopyxis marina]MBC2776236.1 DUF2306 domain-containing protein [Parasphingopyxis marina]